MDLKAIASAAQLQLRLESEIAALGEQLAAKTKELDAVRLKQLPEALSAAGMSTFTLSTGEKIEVKRDYYCSLTGQYKLPAMNWLREEGHDDIISHEVKVSFGRGYKKKDLDALLKLVQKFGNAQAQENDAVNTATFKALVKEQLEKGEVIDYAALGVTIIDAAKITAPKRKVEI